MEYIKINEIDQFNSLFHFTRIDNRDSIETNGLQAVAGGENEAWNDKDNKTIYFSKGVDGILKAVDVWCRWEYDKLALNDSSIPRGHDGYDHKVMYDVVFDKLYNDFKNRQYYQIDLIEGIDFDFNDIDIKKQTSRDDLGRPYIGAVWKYGPYSNFGTPEEPNNTQESWNMNTKMGDRVIPSDRLRIVETEDGRSDGLSMIINLYDKYRSMVKPENNYMFEILDDFIAYSKLRYANDDDYQQGISDLGRREVNQDEALKYQEINKVDTARNR